jgi:hypothetical protein
VVGEESPVADNHAEGDAAGIGFRHGLSIDDDRTGSEGNGDITGDMISYVM